MSLFPELEQEEELFPELKALPKQTAPKQEESLFPEISNSESESLFPELKESPGIPVKELAQSALEKTPILGDLLKAGQSVAEKAPEIAPKIPEPVIQAAKATPFVPPTSLPESVDLAPTIESLKTAPESAVKGLAHGTIGLGEAVNLGGQFLAGRAGSRGAQEFFKSGAQFWEDMGKDYAPPPELQGNILEKPELLGNASWWAYNVSDMAPSLAASLVPGAGASKILSVGGKAIKWTPQVVARLARIGGAITGGAVGGSLEGVQTYKEVLDRGGSEGEAAAAGTMMTLASAGLNALSLGKTFGGKKTNFLKFLADGTTEGITEWLEEPAEGAILSGTDVVRPEDAPMKRLKEGINVLPVAALTGGLGSAAANRQTTLEQTFDEKSQAYLNEKFPTVAKVLEGKTLPMDQKTAQETITNAVAAGEEVLLRGGNPIEAEQAVLSEFQRNLETFSLKPDVAALQRGEKVESAISKEQPLPSLLEVQTPRATEFRKLYTPNTKLAPQQKEIEVKAANYAQENADQILDQYRNKHGNFISVDEMRDFFEPAGYRGELANEFHEPVSALTKLYRQEVMDEATRLGKNRFVVTGGGPGSGKSTWIKQQVISGQIGPDVGATFDSTLANFSEATKLIDDLIKRGKVSVEFVYRDPVEAWQGVLERVQEKGRTVPLGEFVARTKSANENLGKLVAKYKDSVNFSILENKTNEGFQKVPLENVVGKHYNESELKEVLDAETERAFNQGKLTEDQYRSIRAGLHSVQETVPSGRRESSTEFRELEQRAKERSLQPLSPTPPTTLSKDAGIPAPEGLPPLPRRSKDPKVHTERMALRRSLQRQAQAAAQAARATKEELTNLKKQIVQEAQKFLPVSERGWLNSVIASANDGKAVVKAVNRIHAKLFELVRRDLIADFKKIVSRVVDNDRVDVFYRQKIQAIANAFRSGEKRELTLKRLHEIETFVAKQRAEGKDVHMPARILESIKFLHRRSLEDLSIRELTALLDKVDLLEHLGRERVTTRESVYQIEKSRWMKDLVEGVEPLETKKLYEPPPGEGMTFGQFLGNKIAAAQNRARRIDLALTPTDAVMDIADGLMDYEGPHSRMKGELDLHHDSYLSDVHSLTEPVVKLAEELKMGDTNFERIAVHAYRVQPNGREYLKNNGLTDQQIDSIQLTPTELRLYEAMRNQIEKPYDLVVETIRDTQNRDVGKLQNYFPVQIDHDKVSDIELFQRVGDLLDAGAFGLRTKTVQQGFTKEREGTKKAIKLNAMDTFMQHMDDVSYLINMQRPIKMFSEIVNSPRYRARAGDLGAFTMSQWMDTLARKGGGEGVKRIQLLDTLRQNFGAAQLGFKLGTILIQPTALMDGAAQIGGGYAAQGMRRILTSSKWRAFLRDNFPELRARGADDPAFQDLSADKRMRKLQSLGYSYLKKADIITASAIVAGAYQRALDARGIPLDLNEVNRDAQVEAQRLLRRTQSSAFFKDLPQALTRGALTGNKSLDKLILQFRSFMLTRWSQIRHDLWRAGIREGNYQRASEIAFWLTMANVAETGIRYGNRFLIVSLMAGLGAGLKELDDDMEDLPKNFALELAGNVPFVGDFARAVSWQGRSNLIPAASVFSDMITGTSRVLSAHKGKGPKDRFRRFVGGATQAASGAAAGLGIPGTAQAEQLIQAAIKKRKRAALPRLP